MREIALAPFPVTVSHAPDGAPLIEHGHISISHDGDCSAVAISDAPCGIDLCLRSHRDRVKTILRWLRIDCDADPVAQFAALEAVLKLRRLPITRLLDRAIVIELADHDLVVRGIGADVRVELHEHPDFVVAVCG